MSIVAAVAALTMLIIGFAVWNAMTEYRLTIRAAELQTRGYARALKEHAERAFSESDNILLDVVEHIQSHRTVDEETSEHLRTYLDRHPRETPQIGAIIVVNRSGLLFAHSLKAPVKQANVADREYFIHHLNNPGDNAPFISKPIVSRVNGKWRFTLSRPLRASDGSFAGLVAVAFEMEYFQRFYASLDLGEKGRIVVFRKDATPLLTQPFRKDDLYVDFKKSHLFTTYLPASPRGTFRIASGKALLESAGRIISYESLDSFPVVVNANMGIDEVTEQWKNTTLLQSFLTLMALVGLWTLSLALLRQIRRIEGAYNLLEEHQAEIAAAAASWKSTFDSLGEAIWVMDLERRILRCNRATFDIFGASPETAMGRFCCDVAHQDSRQVPSCPFQKMLDTGKRASMQFMIGECWYDVSVDPIKGENGEITGAVHVVTDISTIKQAEDRYRMLVDNLPVVTWKSDELGNPIFMSSVVIRIDGHTPEEIYAGGIEQILSRIHPDDVKMVVDSYRALFEEGEFFDVQFRLRHKDGHWIWIHDFAYATALQEGKRVAYGVFSDITPRKHAEDERDQLEMQLRQAQKMEAIGHLAGGIAHDFNNLLTPILGYAEMVAARLAPSDPLASKVAGITAAAHKAKDLTHQLLSFGRRQPIAANVIDLNEVIESFYIVLRRTIRESISIKLTLDPDGAYITGDRSQMEQIILNMTVNAQDALGGKGGITIETCRMFMEGENVRLHPGMLTGDYILLSFHDNGCGMDDDVLAHIFEPFFTTKAVGHGTGLGLATVYGIVKQHSGYISVTSRKGEGTCFRIYFPANAVAPLLNPETVIAEKPAGSRSGTVLVVEDNEMVREMVRDMLTNYGFNVITAADAVRALALVDEHRGEIALLVSDVVMPGMSGPELYEQLLVYLPYLRVVYISGYPMNPSIRHGTLEEEVSYLQKPFTAEALMERIRQIL